MFYVFDKLTFDINKASGCFHSMIAATKAAEGLKARTGKEYHIIKIEMVWTTKHLDFAD